MSTDFITTVAELDALPVGSAVIKETREVGTMIAQRSVHNRHWYPCGSHVEVLSEFLPPCEVLHRPDRQPRAEAAVNGLDEMTARAEGAEADECDAVDLASYWRERAGAAETALREAMGGAWDEGFAAGLTPPCNANPYDRTEAER